MKIKLTESSAVLLHFGGIHVPVLYLKALPSYVAELESEELKSVVGLCDVITEKTVWTLTDDRLIHLDPHCCQKMVNVLEDGFPTEVRTDSIV